MGSTERGDDMHFEKSPINPSTKIYVAGHTGLVGSALVRVLRNSGYNNLVLRSHRELNLANQAAVAQFFSQECPDRNGRTLAPWRELKYLHFTKAGWVNN